MLFQRNRRMRPMPSECRSPSGRNCSCSSRISRSSSSISFFLHKQTIRLDNCASFWDRYEISHFHQSAEGVRPSGKNCYCSSRISQSSSSINFLPHTASAQINTNVPWSSSQMYSIGDESYHNVAMALEYKRDGTGHWNSEAKICFRRVKVTFVCIILFFETRMQIFLLEK